MCSREGEVVMPIFSFLVRTWRGLVAKQVELHYLNSLSSRGGAQCPGMLGGYCLGRGRKECGIGCASGGFHQEASKCSPPQKKSLSS